MISFSNSKKLSKRNISAKKRVLYGKLGQYQKIREINAGHLYQGLSQSPQSFLMFAAYCKFVVVKLGQINRCLQ